MGLRGRASLVETKAEYGRLKEEVDVYETQ